MFIVTHRKFFYALSVILIAFSFFTVFTHGLNFGIDFKGGSIIEVDFPTGTIATSTAATTAVATSTATTTAAVTVETIKSELQALNIGETVIRQAGEHGFIIRTKSLTEVERKAVVATLGGDVKRFDSVGPVLGQELQGKAIWSIILVMLAIIIFIAFVFRNVSKPVASWKYGVVAVVALMHDIIIPTGFFAYLGRNGGYEIDALFVTALLVILGFSIHDTIVVFDRTRENLKNGLGKKTFEQTVGESVSQTLSRSINTSLTTVLALLALFFFGPETTRNFALALIIGIMTGTYSSIFIGSPLLVTWEKWSSKK
jgi:preprotein translocase subunit SecF